MPMKRKAIYKQLVRRYIENKASDREKEVFFHLLAGGKLDKYLHSEMEAKAGRTLSIAPERPLGTASRNRSALTTLAIRYTAAATFTGLLALTGILWSRYHRRDRNSDHSTAATYYKNEVPPGGNHAILTLAGGLHVVLDSAGQGSLGMQGASRIVKINSGSLFYKAVSGDHSSSYYNTITTPAGGQYQVTLADGTKVWLNALSAIKFPTSFDGPDRTVELTGEAYFEVKADKDKPFLVKAGQTETRVLGTSFNIMAYSDEGAVKTTLLDGAVSMALGLQSALLRPGEQGQYDDNKGSMMTRPVNTRAVVAWKDGYYFFDRTPVKSVMRQIARWYDVTIVYQGAAPKDEIVGKLPRTADVKEVLHIMELIGIHFKIEGKTIVVQG